MTDDFKFPLVLDAPEIAVLKGLISAIFDNEAGPHLALVVAGFINDNVGASRPISFIDVLFAAMAINEKITVEAERQVKERMNA